MFKWCEVLWIFAMERNNHLTRRSICAQVPPQVKHRNNNHQWNEICISLSLLDCFYRESTLDPPRHLIFSTRGPLTSAKKQIKLDMSAAHRSSVSEWIPSPIKESLPASRGMTAPTLPGSEMYTGSIIAHEFRNWSIATAVKRPRAALATRIIGQADEREVGPFSRREIDRLFELLGKVS